MKKKTKECLFDRIDELFKNFGYFNKDILQEAVIVKQAIQKTIQKNKLQLEQEAKKRYLFYELIGEIPYNHSLFSIDFLEWAYFNQCNEKLWNIFLDFEEFFCYLNRQPADLNELQKFTKLDIDTKIKVMLKYSKSHIKT